MNMNEFTDRRKDPRQYYHRRAAWLHTITHVKNVLNAESFDRERDFVLIRVNQ